MNPPIVIYLETNWLVSCVLPHHLWRGEALQLFEDAKAARCELRIPQIALIEARHVVANETEFHAKAIGTTAENLHNAARNLSRADLQKLAKDLRDAEASYRLGNPLKELAEFSAKCSAFFFSNPVKEQEELDRIRDTVIGKAAAEIKPKDITDLYSLAAIVADRELNMGTRAAAFISTNSKEFSVRSASTKLPRDFYSARQIVYGDKFNIQSMEALWAKEVAQGWQAPASPPQMDERRKEAQRMVYALPESSLDKALEALKKL